MYNDKNILSLMCVIFYCEAQSKIIRGSVHSYSGTFSPESDP